MAESTVGTMKGSRTIARRIALKGRLIVQEQGEIEAEARISPPVATSGVETVLKTTARTRCHSPADS
jgi:hypothetical protein